jgi:hypothetical protein
MDTLGKPLSPCRFYPGKNEANIARGYAPATTFRFTSAALASSFVVERPR